MIAISALQGNRIRLMAGSGAVSMIKSSATDYTDFTEGFLKIREIRVIRGYFCADFNLPTTLPRLTLTSN